MPFVNGPTSGNYLSLWTKCCVLSVGKVDPMVDVSLSGAVLPHVTSCRDLGVTVASDLSFSVHVKNIVAKAHQRAM